MYRPGRPRVKLHARVIGPSGKHLGSHLVETNAQGADRGAARNPGPDVPHMADPPPPRPVRWLQRLGLVLRHGHHAVRHARPYARNYCITTGWCNPLLEGIAFFPRLERAVSALTGLEPHRDDAAAAHRYASGAARQ
jgi:hypothetical protein